MTDECAICLEELTDKYEIECKHSFHTKCIVNWFRNGNKECPLCRDKGDDKKCLAPTYEDRNITCGAKTKDKYCKNHRHLEGINWCTKILSGGKDIGKLCYRSVTTGFLCENHSKGLKVKEENFCEIRNKEITGDGKFYARPLYEEIKEDNFNICRAPMYRDRNIACGKKTKEFYCLEHEYLLENWCSHILTKGKDKGKYCYRPSYNKNLCVDHYSGLNVQEEKGCEVCGKKLVSDIHCKAHMYLEKPICEAILKSGPNKGKRCNKHVKNDDVLCGKHKK